MRQSASDRRSPRLLTVTNEITGLLRRPGRLAALPAKPGQGTTAHTMGVLPLRVGVCIAFCSMQKWLLATEIGWDSAIVAGSRALIESIVTGGRFEACPDDEDADISWNGDTIKRRMILSPA